jgi:hypothetical protein
MMRPALLSVLPEATDMSATFIQRLLALPFSLRQNRIANVRPALNEHEFVAQVSKAGGDKRAALLVYQKLGEWIYADGFTPYPEDHLGKLYGIADEELDEDLILDVLHQAGASPPNAEQIAAFGVIDTPLRIAQLVALARRK